MNDVMSPEDYKRLLELGSQNSADEQQIQMMLEQAQQLRQQAGAPEMRGNGRIMVAPNPLEYLGAAANNYSAGQTRQQAMDMQKGMAGRQNEQNQMIMQALLRQRQMQNPEPVANGAPGVLNAPRSPFQLGNNGGM